MADVRVVIRGLDAETAARLVGDLRRAPGLLGRASFEISADEPIRCGACGREDHYAGDNRHDCGAPEADRG